MAARAPRNPTASVDVWLGFTIGISALLLLITVYLELSGQPALVWALLLAGLVGADALLLARRRSILRTAAARAERAEG